MTAPARLAIGAPDGEHLELSIWSRAYPGGLAVFDHNWLYAEVAVKCAARRWRFPAFLRAPDLARLGTRLAALARGERERAVLEPTDPWVAVELRRGKGDRFAGQVRAREGGSERAVQFGVGLPGADLQRLVAQVRSASERFPVRG